MTMSSLIDKHRKRKSVKQIWYVMKSVTPVAIDEYFRKKVNSFPLFVLLLYIYFLMLCFV